jgi:hypothetical protein
MLNPLRRRVDQGDARLFGSKHDVFAAAFGGRSRLGANSHCIQTFRLTGVFSGGEATMRFDRGVEDFMMRSGTYLLGPSYVGTLDIRSPRQRPAQPSSPLPEENEARQRELAEAVLISAERSNVAGSRWVHGNSDIL